MDDFLYVATSGARQAMLAQAINSNNMAHADTPGFRSDLVLAKSNFVRGAGLESRVFGGVQGGKVDFREGVINTTGRELDIAINGEGWLTVATEDGGEGYTRRGDLHVTSTGQLLNGAGQQLIGKSGPIALPPYSELTIGSDGTISIVALGEDPNSVTDIDHIKLVNPDTATLAKGVDGLMRTQPGTAAPATAPVNLLSGSLESSNVNTIEAMVRMIELARKFESYIKLTSTAEQMDQSSSELMALN